MKLPFSHLIFLTGFFALAGCQTATTPTTTATNTTPLHTQRSPAEEQARAILLQAIDLYNQKNYAQAKPIFEQAMNAGDFKAPRYLGLMALNGLDEPTNPKLAFDYFTQSAKKGDITSQYWLGYCYENGIGTTKDLAQALTWYTTSAQRGDIIAVPAMTALGRWYETGVAGTIDRRQALTWYQKASQAGDTEATQTLQ